MSGSTVPAPKLSLRQRLRQALSSTSSAVRPLSPPQSIGDSSVQHTPSGSSPLSAVTGAGQPSNNNPDPPLSRQNGPPYEIPSQSLLERALQRLSPSEHATIAPHFGSTPVDVHLAIGQAIAAAEVKRQACLDKRWTFSVAGRKLVLREEAEKTIGWLDRFKAVGDIAANVDPVHFGLPWAGVRLLLEVRNQPSHEHCVS